MAAANEAAAKCKEGENEREAKSAAIERTKRKQAEEILAQVQKELTEAKAEIIDLKTKLAAAEAQE